MYLEKIVDYKRQELEASRRKMSLKDARKKAEDTEPSRDFTSSLKAPGVRIIAEVKKASPSAGLIRPDFDAVSIARAYEDNGAAALSILTDEHFFQGRLKYLEDIKAKVKIPCLRKDFTLDVYHVYEARAHGADAVLLIVRILEDAQVKDYAALAQDLGMAALVEVHDGPELKRAAKAGAVLIGINNRNLDTFKVDLETTVRLAPEAPKGSVLIAESGLSKPNDLKRLNDSGVRTFLIGETFMRASDPGRALGEMLKATF